MTTRIPTKHDTRRWSPRDDAILLQRWGREQPWLTASLLVRSARACEARFAELKAADASE